MRAAAIGVQRAAPITEGPSRLAGMLADPVKAVRIAAAREFLSYQIASMPGPLSENLDSALGEWQQSLLAKTDFPETHMVLGGVGLTTRRMTYALGAFGEAVTLDPQLERAWIMMIRIHVALGDRPMVLQSWR